MTMPRRSPNKTNDLMAIAARDVTEPLWIDAVNDGSGNLSCPSGYQLQYRDYQDPNGTNVHELACKKT
jgi:hypothetical protein